MEYDKKKMQKENKEELLTINISLKKFRKKDEKKG